jgi:hypothetical protein
VPDYDTTFTQALIGEIEALPEKSALAAAIADCAVLRDQVRACKRSGSE